MKKPNSISLAVQSTTLLTPNMQRIVMHGEGLSSFPADCAGGYIKLLFNEQGGTDLSLLVENESPVRRTYTIREFDAENNLITVDFVRHEVNDCGCGHAARWAMNAKAGDEINIAGPGSIQNINQEADWFFLVADMTALPALSVKLNSLPESAKGYAVIEVLSQDDVQPLSAPQNMDIIWVEKQNEKNVLVDNVIQQHWMEGIAAVWCACEFDSMRALRQYFRNEKDVERDNIYISSYWKNGVTEEGHKVIKREDAASV